MGKYIGPKNRLSRREGMDLFGRGNKLRRASQPPGQHGPKGVRRRSDYGIQLREKQKTKRLYGIMEQEFRRYFEKASRFRGATGGKLLELLETRLDNVVYRLGFVPSRIMARQLTSHGHVWVDGQPVNSPSYQVRPGERVTLDTKAQNMAVIRSRLEDRELPIPVWLTRFGAVGKIERLPTRSQIDTAVNEQLIVEFYSR